MPFIRTIDEAQGARRCSRVRLQTSSDEAQIGAGLDARADQASPLLLVNMLRLRQAAARRGWRAYRDDLGGFALGWAPPEKRLDVVRRLGGA